jgi:hypothetical protein
MPASGQTQQAADSQNHRSERPETLLLPLIRSRGNQQRSMYQRTHSSMISALKRNPPPVPVHLIYHGQRHVPLKLRAFLDYSIPRLSKNSAVRP